MVETGVILAAGLGSRLGDMTESKPKGFLSLEDRPIVEWSICKLIEQGIKTIIIGTGYRCEAYEQLAEKYPQVKCVKNEQYENTGSMYTLYKLRDCISDDFILLESDLIYDKTGLAHLLQREESDVILASGLTGSNDEVLIETDKNGRLVNMSKNKDELSRIDAELTGITKLSYATFKLMCNFVENNLGFTSNLDYENVLAGICQTTDIYIYKLEGFAWCEIDDKSHWQRAVTEIYHKIKVREKGLPPVQRNILLNPGPATTTDSVKYAQVVPDICPRKKEFGNIMQFISTELTGFAANSEDYTTVLFGGSGTAAVESILSSVIGDDVILIVNNGAYGKRMCQVAEVYKLNYIEFPSGFDQALDLSCLEDTIRKAHRKPCYLAIVHNETTTGLLNDIVRVGELSKKYNIKMIVDAMSSFGAIPINMDKMNISYLAASSNKNLQGVAGVSFVIAYKASLESTKEIRPRNYYLHLYSQYKYFSETFQMRFTPPVQTLYALKEAIIETKLEGIENRYERYKQSWKVLIDGITGLGLKHLVNEKDHSKIITAVLEPDCSNYNFDEMHDYLYSKGFTLYPGKLDQFNTFRIANIGDISFKDIESFLVVLEQYLRSIGFIK